MLKQSRLSLLLLLAVWVLFANAFVPSPSLAKTRSSSQQLFVASQQEEEPAQDEGTPATVFGKPVGDGAKKFNKEAVQFIKQYLFDNLYAEDSVECAFARFWTLEEIARMPYAGTSATDDIAPHTRTPYSYDHTISSNTHPPLLHSSFIAYLMALHLYETMGLWRKSEYLKIHFAETWNEQQ